MWTDLSEDIAMGIPNWSVQGGPTILTTMTESDWTIVLQIFRASRSRRGDQGRDDRKFLEISAAAAHLHLTGGEASDTRNFEFLLDLGPDIAPRGRSRTMDTFQSQSRRCPQTRNMSSHSISRKRADRPAFSRNYSTKRGHASSKRSASSSASSASRYDARKPRATTHPSWLSHLASS